ncbi:hypothetical protein GCM10009692_08550 [Leucobacter aridicollis]
MSSSGRVVSVCVVVSAFRLVRVVVSAQVGVRRGAEQNRGGLLGAALHYLGTR